MIEFLRKEDTNWACSDPKVGDPGSDIFEFPFIVHTRCHGGLRRQEDGAYGGGLITAGTDVLDHFPLREVYEICFAVIPIPEVGEYYVMTDEQIDATNDILNKWLSL